MGNPEGARAVNTEELDAPSSYSDVDNPARPQGEPSSYASAPSANNPAPGTSIYTKFPQKLNAYHQNKISRTFQLGVTRNQPLFAVKFHSGLTSNPEVEVFDGPSDTYPLLATARRKGLRGLNTIAMLPASPRFGLPASTELVKVEWGWGNNGTYRFSVEVDAGTASGKSKWRREAFEWRRSRGNEVRELTRWWSTGWKLVRLESRPEGASGGGRAQRSDGVTSDGKEIVAVWAQNASLSMTKAFKMEFRGSAALGTLGERWEIMAVVTALRLWVLARKRKRAARASAA
ncbi:hypothetical protein DL771_003971 [Monosporascus sp. 5C6A]|nr:hypothetical protein DL771_003971 [Monosporascus sp. 5C6A]